MKRWTAVGILILAVTGCPRYEPAKEMTRVQEGLVQSEASGVQNGQETQEVEVADSQVIIISTHPLRNPVKVKGIYVSAYVAGTDDTMDKIAEEVDGTELNAVVIDVKDDQGRITYAMDSSMANETGACQIFIQDMPAFMAKLKEYGIYAIARVVAFRDPYPAEQKPGWSLHVTDGKIYRDNKGLAWVSPYKKEVWDYPIEVGRKADEAGFDKIQSDYIRFAVDKTMNDVVFSDVDTQGRDKTQAITEFIGYARDELAKEGLFVSADVFGTIIRSEEDAAAVGQEYENIAEQLDYICPIIYPSHYGPGSLGIEYPDTQPYDIILNVLNSSREFLATPVEEDTSQAVARPWLRDFTVSYLEHYIKYDDEQVRQQIQAVYDAGYDQWILWDAGVSYHYGGLLTLEEAEEEDQCISQSRVALETERNAAESVPVETVPAENAPLETVPPEVAPSENAPPEIVPSADVARQNGMLENEKISEYRAI